MKFEVFTSSLEDPRITYSLIRMSAGANEARPTRRPVNLAVVLDRSSSMRGPRLAQAVLATRRLVERLDERDRLGVVAFDGVAKVLLPAGPVTAAVRDKLLAALTELGTGAGTNLAAGWRKGCEMVSSGFVREAVSRVVLLTDGQPSVGPTDADELGALVAEQSTRGVTTTAMGIGEGFDDRVLGEMARRGKGGFYYLATPEAIPAAFGRELAGVFALFATSVEVKLIAEPEVASFEVLHRLVTRPTADGLVVEVGEIASEAPRQFLVRFVRDDVAPGKLLAKVAVTWRDAAGETGAPHLDRVTVPSVPMGPERAEIALERLRLAAAAAIDEAWARRASGRRADAIQALVEVRSAIAGARERNLAPLPALAELTAELSATEDALGRAVDEVEKLRRRARERSHVTFIGQSLVAQLPPAALSDASGSDSDDDGSD